MYTGHQQVKLLGWRARWGTAETEVDDYLCITLGLIIPRVVDTKWSRIDESLLYAPQAYRLESVQRSNRGTTFVVPSQAV